MLDALSEEVSLAGTDMRVVLASSSCTSRVRGATMTVSVYRSFIVHSFIVHFSCILDAACDIHVSSLADLSVQVLTVSLSFFDLIS